MARSHDSSGQGSSNKFPQSRNVIADKRAKWPSPTIINIGLMEISGEHSSHSHDTLWRMFKECVEEWISGTGIKCIFVCDAADATVRVRILIVPNQNPEYQTGNTFLGTDAIWRRKEEATSEITIGYCSNDVSIRYIMLHEFGHVLAFQHEHQSPALPVELIRKAIYNAFAYYEPGDTNEDMTEKKKAVDHNILDPLKPDDIEVYPPGFDGDSCMGYEIHADCTVEGERILRRSGELSAGDIEGARHFYPEVTGPPSSTQVMSAGGEKYFDSEDAELSLLTRVKSADAYDAYAPRHRRLRSRQNSLVTATAYRRYNVSKQLPCVASDEHRVWSRDRSNGVDVQCRVTPPDPDCEAGRRQCNGCWRRDRQQKRNDRLS
jgi:hypothetical protein